MRQILMGRNNRLKPKLVECKLIKNKRIEYEAIV